MLWLSTVFSEANIHIHVLFLIEDLLRFTVRALLLLLKEENQGQGGVQSDAMNGLVYPALHLHPLNDSFAPKQISLAPPGPHNRVKIGRQTNAKSMPHPSNGYFDSKVLSRMHAEVWCQDGKVSNQ